MTWKAAALASCCFAAAFMLLGAWGFCLLMGRYISINWKGPSRDAAIIVTDLRRKPHPPITPCLFQN